MMKPLILILVLFGMPLAVMADDAPATPTPPPPPPTPQMEGESLEPEVTITQTDGKTTYEYSINGRRYMVKIVPAAGPAYYLLDLDGDGEMDTQEDDPRRLVVPHWVLFRW